MKSELCSKLGIETPIFAFSHCRDVVAAASRAGGIGIFGATRYSPEELEIELSWIDRHCGGKPYGVDVVLPETYDRRTEESDVDPYALIPKEHVNFFEKFFEEEGVPLLSPEEENLVRTRSLATIKTRATAQRHVDVALRHPNVKLIVNALGAPEKQQVDFLHSKGLLVGSLVGSPHHAERQLAADVDIIVAQGTEAAGHTGQISTLVLVPQVVAVAGERAAVVAAGGIMTGAQLVAMIALGAQGVWCGTRWLCTPESDLGPEEKATLLSAKSGDTSQVKYITGKPVRVLNSKLSQAMKAPGSPPPLKAPLQQLLFEPFGARVRKGRRYDVAALGAAGQGVGMAHDERSVRQLFTDMVNEAADALDRIGALTESA